MSIEEKSLLSEDLLLIGDTYYLLKDSVYDKAYQDILLDTDYTLENNMEDIISYFSDNIADLLDDIDYPIDDNTDVTPAIEGFAEYVKWLYDFLPKKTTISIKEAQ